MAKRSKRRRRVVAYLTDEVFEQLELFRQEENVISMSDYLFAVARKHIQAKETMRASHQMLKQLA